MAKKKEIFKIWKHIGTYQCTYGTVLVVVFVYKNTGNYSFVMYKFKTNAKYKRNF